MLLTTSGLPLLTFGLFPDRGFVHAVSTRHGGVSPPPYDSLNLSLAVRDEPGNVRGNRRRLAEAIGGDVDRLVGCRQVHGDNVLIVDDQFSPSAPLVGADIQMTDRPGWLLSLRFADCTPILMVHPGRRAVAAVHAGWRGTAKGAVGTAIKALQERYAADPAGLLVGIGPAIGPCCYEVGEEVAQHFAAAPSALARNGSARPHLDLWALNRQAACRAGVPPEQIEVAELCTRCESERFFSHRAEGFPAGRFGAVIGLT